LYRYVYASTFNTGILRIFAMAKFALNSVRARTIEKDVQNSCSWTGGRRRCENWAPQPLLNDGGEGAGPHRRSQLSCPSVRFDYSGIYGIWAWVSRLLVLYFLNRSVPHKHGRKKYKDGDQLTGTYRDIFGWLTWDNCSITSCRALVLLRWVHACSAYGGGLMASTIAEI